MSQQELGLSETIKVDSADKGYSADINPESAEANADIPVVNDRIVQRQSTEQYSHLSVKYENVGMLNTELFSIASNNTLKLKNIKLESKYSNLLRTYSSELVDKILYTARENQRGKQYLSMQVDNKNQFDELKNLKQVLECKIRELECSLKQAADEIESFKGHKIESDYKIQKMKEMVRQIQEEMQTHIYGRLEQKEKLITDKSIQIRFYEQKNQELLSELDKLKSLERDFRLTVNENVSLANEVSDLKTLILKQEEIINNSEINTNKLKASLREVESELHKIKSDNYSIVKLLDEQKINLTNSVSKLKQKDAAIEQNRYLISEKEIEIKQLKNFAISLKGEMGQKDNLISGLRAKVGKITQENIRLESLMQNFKSGHLNLSQQIEKSKLFGGRINERPYARDSDHFNLNTSLNRNNNDQVQLQQANAKQDTFLDDQDEKLKELSVMMNKILND